MKNSRQGKTITFVLTAFIAFALGITSLMAQTTVKVDENGNFVQVTPEPALHDSITGKVFLKKDIAHEVFKGKRGGLYYWKKSKKSGNWYKVYIKIEETTEGTL